MAGQVARKNKKYLYDTFDETWHEISDAVLKGESAVCVDPFCYTNEGVHRIIFTRRGSTAKGLPKGIARIDGKCHHKVRFMTLSGSGEKERIFIFKKCLPPGALKSPYKEVWMRDASRRRAAKSAAVPMPIQIQLV